jgi:hypothetical protein
MSHPIIPNMAGIVLVIAAVTKNRQSCLWMDTNSTWNLNYSYIQCRLFYIFIYIQWYSVFFKQVVKKMFVSKKNYSCTRLYKYAPNLESLLTQQYVCIMCTLWSDITCVFTRFHSVKTQIRSLSGALITYGKTQTNKKKLFLGIKILWK